MAAEHTRTLGWVIVTLALAMTVFCWGLLAGSYAGAQATPLSEMSDEELAELKNSRSRSRRGEGMGQFFAVAVEQLPHLPQVIRWHAGHRRWLLVVVLLLEGGVVAFAVILKRVDAALNAPRDE